MPSTRRQFIQTAGAASAALSAAAQAGKSANDKIQFATIGIGGMGLGDTETAVSIPGTQLVAVCDCYQGRLDHAREQFGQGIAITRDYKEILARPEVDAVIIATPDHLHAQIATEAMNAGKDVYVQKPMVQKWQDGLKVVDAAKKNQRVLQVGSQRVSSATYKKAKDIYASGAIGQLNMVEAWWDRNSAIGAWQYSIPLDASPQTVDWQRFLGPAPQRPYDATRFFRWRNYQDYGTGVAGDLFVHLFSGLHFILDVPGPTRVFSTGGLRFWNDGRDVPDVMLGLYDYPKTATTPAFNLVLRVNFVNGGSENSGFKFTGSEGYMTVGNGVALGKVPPETEPGMTLGAFSKATQEKIIAEYRKKYPPQKSSADSLQPTSEERWNAPRGYSDQVDHHANFFNAVRTRQAVVEDAVFGMRAAAPAVLSNESYYSGRIVEWDPINLTTKKS